MLIVHVYWHPNNLQQATIGMIIIKSTQNQILRFIDKKINQLIYISSSSVNLINNS